MTDTEGSGKGCFPFGLFYNGSDQWGWGSNWRKLLACAPNQITEKTHKGTTADVYKTEANDESNTFQPAGTPDDVVNGQFCLTKYYFCHLEKWWSLTTSNQRQGGGKRGRGGMRRWGLWAHTDTHGKFKTQSGWAVWRWQGHADGARMGMSV